jgi:hypothetical protein
MKSFSVCVCVCVCVVFVCVCVCVCFYEGPSLITTYKYLDRALTLQNFSPTHPASPGEKKTLTYHLMLHTYNSYLT